MRPLLSLFDATFFHMAVGFVAMLIAGFTIVIGAGVSLQYTGHTKDASVYDSY